MKKLLPIILTALMAAPAFAGNMKIGIVDMLRVYIEYNKTREDENELNKDKEEAKGELEERTKAYQDLQKEIETLQKDFQSKSLNEDMRLQAQKKGESKMKELQALARDIQEFARRREAQLNDKLMRMRRVILDELKKEVEAKSAADGYDIVFDKSARSINGVPFLLYSKDAIDFTDQLVKIVNQKHPLKPGTPDPRPEEIKKKIDEASNAPIDPKKTEADVDQADPKLKQE